MMRLNLIVRLMGLMLLIFAFNQKIYAFTQVPGFSPEEKQWLANHPVIRVGADQNWPPFDFVNKQDQHQGIAADYLDIISNLLGVEFKVTGKQWKDVIAGIKNHQFELLACAANTAERREYLLFTDPYVLIDTVIVISDQAKAIQILSDLKGKTVVLPKGTYIHEMLKTRFPEIKLKFVKSNQEALNLLSLNQADAYIGNLAVVTHVIERDLLSNLKITAKVAGEKSALSFAIDKKHPVLHSILQKALDVISNEQRLEIRRKWIPLAHDQLQPQALQLSLKEQDWLNQHPVITLGAESDWPPYDFVDEDGEYQGITADYLELIENRLGIHFDVITRYSWAEMLEKARNREIDVVGTIVKTEQREQSWNFSEAYFAYPDVIYTHQEGPEINRLSDLKGLSVAIEKGFSLEQEITDLYPEIHLQQVKNTSAAVRALSYQHVDAYIGNQGAANWWIAHHALTNLKVAADTGMQQKRVHFAVREDWPMLTTMLNKALASISIEQHNAISIKWLGVTQAQENKVAFSRQQQQWLDEHASVRIGIDPSWPPIEFLDNQHHYQGIASEYVAMLENKLAISMSYAVDLTWEQVIELVKQQQIDVLPAVSPTPEREKYLLFTRPYLKFPYVIFTRDDAPLITGIDELDGALVVVEKDYANHEILRTQHSDIRLLLVDNTEQALSALALGQAEAYVGNLAATSHIIINSGLTNIRVAAPTPYSNDLAFAVRKDWPQLLDIIQLALDSVSPEQSNAFKKKWFAIRYSHEVDYTLVRKVVIGALSLLMMFGFWLWKIRQQKQALAVSYQRFDLAMSAAKEGLWDWNIKTGRVYFSPGYFEMLGYQPGELSDNHRTWEKLLHPLDRKKAIRKVVSAIARCVTHYEHEFRLKHKSGGYRLIRSYGSVVSVDPQGKALRAVGTQIDITEYSLAQKHLKQQQYALNTGSIVSIADAKGVITYVNEKFSQISGYQTEELIGHTHKKISSGIHPQAYWQEMYHTTAQGIPWRKEVCNRAKDGSEYWLDTTIVGLLDENNRIEKYISIRTDMTQRKQAEKQLAQAKQIAEQASRQKSDFLANMSHEIRTPMNAIIGMGHLLVTTELTVKQRDYVDKMQTAGQSLLILINDILDFSKIEAGKLHLESIDFDLNDVLTQVSDLFRFEIEQKQLELFFKVSSDTPVSLIGDPLRLRQIFINLVSNAVKFTQSGAITISVAVCQVKTGQVLLQFRVADQGIGIKAEQLFKLFDSFYQTDTSTTRHFGGTGLGLAICKKLVELMNGEISAASEPGQGSQFSFTAEFGLRKQQTFKHLFDEPGLKGLRVLLLESGAERRTTLRDLLVSLSFTVAVAEQPRKAISILQSADKVFDLILLCTQIPQSNALKFAYEVKNDSALCHIPIIMISHIQAYERLMAEAEKIPVQGVITKPVTPSSIFDGIMKVFSEIKKIDVNQRNSDYKLGHDRQADVKILLVEDHAVNRQVAQEILVNFGCSVDIAENGRQAVEKVNKMSYDLVLMDIQMPEMDGLQATRIIRSDKQYQKLTIIAMTAHAMQGDRQKSILAGMNDHITKPIDPEQLFKTLCHWLPEQSQLSVALDKKLDQSAVQLPVDSEFINISIGVKRVGGNRKLLRKLLIEFYQDHQGDPALLKAAIEQKQYQKAKRLLHTITGVTGNIGAELVFKLSEQLQARVDYPEDKQTIVSQEDFYKAFNGLLDTLKGMHDQQKPETHGLLPTIDSNSNPVDALRQLLETGDAEALDYFESAKMQLLVHNNEDMLVKLEAALENYDFDEALEILRNI